ncbi:MAG: O-antigen ligase family protein [Streptosporangiaceae bacterium]
MTAAGDVAQAATQHGHRGSALVRAIILVAVLVAAFVIGRQPLLVAAGIVALVIVGVFLRRLDLAVAVLAAGFFFNNYLANGAGIITADKVIGALAVAAWGLDWAINGRPILTSRGLWLLIGFLIWVGVSIVMARSYQAAFVTSLRYLTFGTLYFLVLQTVRGDRRRADVLVTVMVAAAAIASLIGLIAFFSHHVTRASGPISDPNDFGFLLASSLPLAIYQIRWRATRWAKAGWSLALILILACSLATFSRSALLGLIGAGIWATVTGRIRLRWLIAALATGAAVALSALLFAPQLVQTAFGLKAHIAVQNIDVRFGYYRVEIKEWESYPITGVGPGNFVYRFYEFAPAANESLPFPSNVLTISGEDAYLVILAEQGAVGLALFLGYLAISWTDLRRRFPGDARTDSLQGALAAGFVVACIGALFLAEQYYPPLWFLPAVGASLASRRRSFDTQSRSELQRLGWLPKPRSPLGGHE